MIEIKKKDRETDVYCLDGTEDEIIAELGELIYAELLNIATANGGSEGRLDNYKDLTKRFINYIETTVDRVDSLKY